MQMGLGVRIAQGVVAVATAFAILGVAILPFLTPQWVGFEQGRSNALALLNACPKVAQGCVSWSDEDVRIVTNAILHDLVLGPPAFDVRTPVGRTPSPVLSLPEREHMRDVRSVFAWFYLAAIVSGAALAVTLAQRAWRSRAWPAIRAGAIGLGAGLVVGGVIVAVAFDAAFEVFHRLFFSAGTYTFDPRTDKLVQLFPEQFWSETAIAVGAIAFALAALVAVAAGRQTRLAGDGTAAGATPAPADRSSVGVAP